MKSKPPRPIVQMLVITRINLKQLLQKPLAWLTHTSLLILRFQLRNLAPPYLLFVLQTLLTIPVDPLQVIKYCLPQVPSHITLVCCNIKFAQRLSPKLEGYIPPIIANVKPPGHPWPPEEFIVCAGVALRCEIDRIIVATLLYVQPAQCLRCKWLIEEFILGSRPQYGRALADAVSDSHD